MVYYIYIYYWNLQFLNNICLIIYQCYWIAVLFIQILFVVLDPPSILENHAIFYDHPLEKKEKVENNPNYIGNDYPIIWTNLPGLLHVETKMAAKYAQPNPGNLEDHFVTDFKVGLIEMKTTLSLYRGWNFKFS